MAELIVRSKLSDGHLRVDDDVYATAHDQAGADWIYPSSSYIRVGHAHSHYLEDYTIWRGVLIFDTADLPANAVILSAVLGFYGYWDYSDVDFDIVVVSGAGLSDPFVAADYGNLLDDVVSRGSMNTSDFVTSAWNEIVLNTTGISEIVKGGTTIFGMRSSRDINSLPPAPWVEPFDQRESITFRARDYSATYAPKLTIIYTDAPGFVWTEGDKLHFISEKIEQQIRGTALATALAGHLFVESISLHYVDENGRERRQWGKDTGFNASAGSEGQMWIDDMWIYYVDSNLNIRKLGTWILGSSTLGVDTILHA